MFCVTRDSMYEVDGVASFYVEPEFLELLAVESSLRAQLLDKVNMDEVIIASVQCADRPVMTLSKLVLDRCSNFHS